MAWTLQTWRPEPMSYDPANQQAKRQIDPREMLYFQAREAAARQNRQLQADRDRQVATQKASARSQYANAAMMAARSGKVSDAQLSSMQRTFGVDDQPQSPAERQAERLRRTDELLRRARLGNAQYDLKKQQQMRQTEADKANPNKGYENSRIEVQVMPGGPTRVLTGADTRLTDQKQGNFGMTQPGYQNLAGMNADVAQRYGQAPQPQQGQVPNDPYAAQRHAAATQWQGMGLTQEQIDRLVGMGGVPNAPYQAAQAPQQPYPQGALAVREAPPGYAAQQAAFGRAAYPGEPDLPNLTPGQHAYVQDKMGGVDAAGNQYGYRINAPMVEGPGSAQGRGPAISQAESEQIAQIQRLGGQWSRIAQDYAKGIRDANTPEGRQGMEADRQAQIAQFQQAVPNPQDRAKIAQFYGMDPAWIGMPAQGGQPNAQERQGPSTGAWQSPMGPPPTPNLSGLRSQSMPWDVFSGGQTPYQREYDRVMPGFAAARNASNQGGGTPPQIGSASRPGQQPGPPSYSQGVVGIPGYAEGINANYATNPGMNQGRIDSFDAEIKAAQQRLAPMLAEDVKIREAQMAGGGEGGLPAMGGPLQGLQARKLEGDIRLQDVGIKQLEKMGPAMSPTDATQSTNAPTQIAPGDAGKGAMEGRTQFAARLSGVAERAMNVLGSITNPTARRQAALTIQGNVDSWESYKRIASYANLPPDQLLATFVPGVEQWTMGAKDKEEAIRGYATAVMAAKKFVDMVSQAAQASATQPGNAQQALPDWTKQFPAGTPLS